VTDLKEHEILEIAKQTTGFRDGLDRLVSKAKQEGVSHVYIARQLHGLALETVVTDCNRELGNEFAGDLIDAICATAQKS
jgi:hypothetical protein